MTYTILAIPDSQNGFRDNKPTHDRDAWEAAVHLASEASVDRIVLLGDMVDLPALSKYPHGNDLRGHTKKTIDETKWWLARLAALGVPVEYIFGNHEERLPALFKKHCPDLADVYTLQDALGLADLGITPHAPYGTDFRYKDVVFTHGDKHATHGGQTAAKYLATASPLSVVYGHCHKSEVAWKTPPYGRPKFACSPGTISNPPLVPGASAHPDWQKSLALIHFDGQQSWPELVPYLNKKLYRGVDVIKPPRHDHRERAKALGF